MKDVLRRRELESSLGFCKEWYSCLIAELISFPLLESATCIDGRM